MSNKKQKKTKIEQILGILEMKIKEKKIYKVKKD